MCIYIYIFPVCAHLKQHDHLGSESIQLLEKSKKDSKRYQNIRKWKTTSVSYGAKKLLKLLVLYRQQWHRQQFMRTGDRRCSPIKMQPQLRLQRDLPAPALSKLSFLHARCRSGNQSPWPEVFGHHVFHERCCMSNGKKSYNPLRAHFAVSVI